MSSCAISIFDSLGDVDGAEVLVVGAGFSKAISSEMPLLRELGQAVTESLTSSVPGVNLPEFSDLFTFEDWLTILSDRPPHFTEPEWLANAALFSRARVAIASIISDREQRVLQGSDAALAAPTCTSCTRSEECNHQFQLRPTDRSGDSIGAPPSRCGRRTH